MKNRFSDAFDIHARIVAGETVLLRTIHGDYYLVSLGKHSHVGVFAVFDVIEEKAYSDEIITNWLLHPFSQKYSTGSI